MNTIHKYRWPIMILVSFTVFGSYLAYDSIGPITPMLKKEFAFTGKDIGLLYSIYSLPNIIMVFLGGMVFDKIGSRKAAILFTMIMFIGTAIVATAPGIQIQLPFLSAFVTNKTLLWMLAGRFLFGIGSESLIVAQSAIIGKWFRDKELALAFGLNLTVSRLGTAAAFFTFGKIAELSGSITPVLWASAVLCLFSILSITIYALLETKAASKYPQTFKEEKQDEIKFTDIKKFRLSFWYICILCAVFYSSFFPFTAFSTDFLHEKWGLSQDLASKMTGIPITFSMVFSPVFGALIDKFGKRNEIMIAGSMLLIPVFILLGFTDINPWIPMSILGIAFSLVPAALWPSIPLMTEQKLLGTAYGITTMIQNIGLTIFPFVIGGLYDKTGNYTASMLALACMAVLALLFSLLLKKTE